jgi:hypothetical protein
MQLAVMHIECHLGVAAICEAPRSHAPPGPHLLVPLLKLASFLYLGDKPALQVSGSARRFDLKEAKEAGARLEACAHGRIIAAAIATARALSLALLRFLGLPRHLLPVSDAARAVFC